MDLVSVEDLHKTYHRGGRQAVQAVRGVSLKVQAGSTLGIIGESGSGKSTLGRLMLRLTVPDAGRVVFEGVDLAQLSSLDIRAMRGDMGVVFQEPYESLNPRQRIAVTVGEPLRIHAPGLTAKERTALVLHGLERVGLDSTYANRYPHELSGGEQQRVGIARAVVTRPKFLVLDEPTSSLDLSVRAQILKLLRDLQDDEGLTYVLISHDIRTIGYMSQNVAVMYQGEIVEQGDREEIMSRAQHPYTRRLLGSVLSVNPDVSMVPLSDDDWSL